MVIQNVNLNQNWVGSIGKAEKQNSLSVGEEIYMVGFPNGMYSDFSLPLYRKGILASDPRFSDTFFIDMEATVGSSGSPIFLKRMVVKVISDDGECEVSYEHSILGVGYLQRSMKERVLFE